MDDASPTKEAARFAQSLDRLVPTSEVLGLAVSGGPDSLALLTLAHEVRPAAIRAITVDHRLRPESATEAETVAALCRRLGIAHDIVAIDWPDGPPTANIEAGARDKRYAAFEGWARRHRLHYIATAHHADDQAETLFMRLARGAGLAGLAGIRPRRALREDLMLVRPLLGWEKAELVGWCQRHDLPIVDDPMNADPQFDRVRIRRALADVGFEGSVKWTESAGHLADAEEALSWTAQRLAEERLRETDTGWALVRGTIPRELLRRLLLVGFERLGDRPPRGPDLARAMETLEKGGQCTLGTVLLNADGDLWTLAPAPPRNT